MVKDWLRQIFSKRVAVQLDRNKKTEFIEVLPSDQLIYGIMFAITALICLVTLEIIYMLIFTRFNSEIFACITFTIGTILGSFFTQKT